jgi:Flp pilus assembly protein TadD
MDTLAAGWEHYRAGRNAEAEAVGRERLLADPANAEAWHLLGLVSFRLERLDEAETRFQNALAARPEFAQAHGELGVILAIQGRLDQAVTSFRRALTLGADSADAHNNLGMALFQLGRFDEAAASLHRAVALAPDRPASHAILARALRSLGRLEEALASTEQVLRLCPEDAQAHRDRGFLLDELRRCDEAVASYDQAIHLDPGHEEAHHNRGVTLGKLARYEEAIAAFDEALRLVPDYPEARRNRAMALLTLGDLERGWEEFEWRWKCRDLTMPSHPKPLWQGEPLQGRTILLHVEQGLGDTLQFIRYAPLVQARGGRVVVECQKPLVPLVATCPGIDQIVARGDALPAFDVHSPLLRLMGLFTTTLETIPASIPYLRADAGRVDRWRHRLADWPGFQVGVAWQGNPKHTRDRDRSFPLAQFERLAGIAGVRLISLQKGHGTEQLRELGGRFPVVDLGDLVDPDLATMQDTPAVMMTLDLIVTLDTSLAHLAGALGLPVWIALPKAPDWRWLIGRDDSPWYPTARLFRQSERGCWGPVFDRIAAALQEQLGLS